jgi:galactose mutarotase-like enzyme
VFPNPGAPSTWQGIPFGQHDEVAGLSWTVTDATVHQDGASVTCTVDTERLPFRVTRTIHLAAAAPTLTVATSIENSGTQPVPGAVGEHLAFGPPLVGPGRGRLALPPARTWIADRDDHSAVMPKAVPRVPSANDHAEWATLPPVGTPSRMWYLTDLPAGRYEVWAADGPWGVAVTWDADQLPYLWYWGEFGAGGYPWWGRHYTVGLEPFTSWPTHGLAAAVENGSARWWAPGERFAWTITLTVLEGTGA